jgi:hypothetical protein
MSRRTMMSGIHVIFEANFSFSLPFSSNFLFQPQKKSFSFSYDFFNPLSQFSSPFHLLPNLWFSQLFHIFIFFTCRSSRVGCESYIWFYVHKMRAEIFRLLYNFNKNIFLYVYRWPDIYFNVAKLIQIIFVWTVSSSEK